MDAYVKEFFIKEAITCMWTGQAVENFYNPRSRWGGSSTLIKRLRNIGFGMDELADSFSWEDTPQGRAYWVDMGEE